MSAKEELIRVERFEELRAGDYIELRDCAICGAAHRGILLRLVTTSGMLRGRAITNPAWQHEPPAHPRAKAHNEIGDYAVSERRVYRVETGLEASTTETKSKRHPKPARVG